MRKVKKITEEKVLQSLLSNVLHCMGENKYISNNHSKRARYELLDMISDAQELSQKLIPAQEARNVLRLIFKS